MKKRILLLVCLMTGLFSGCADRAVDYDLNGEGTEHAINSTLEQFAEAENWNDEVTITAENGSETHITINAQVVLPAADDMSVVEVEEAVVDGEYKKMLLTCFFEDGEIYYHDLAHCTREELEDMIAEAENSISDLRKDLAENPQNYGAVNFEEWFEYQEEQLQEYRRYLQTAKDTYTLAEDFDICNAYAGYRDGILYGVSFQARNEAAQTVAWIDIRSMDDVYVGPESLKDYDEVARIHSDYMWSGESAGTEAGTNECVLSQEEAKALADRFVERSGRANQICFQESEILWQGQKLGEREAEGFYIITDQADAVYGYEFVYGTGVDEIAFASFGGLMAFDQFWTIADIPENWYDTDDQIQITVTDAGIIDVRMEYPITINHVTRQVELLPLETVQSIMKNELKENGSRYDFSQSKYFNTLELIYFRLKDDYKTGSYSYVPVWCLCGKDKDIYRHAVLVNAIDGSVIYLQDEI